MQISENKLDKRIILVDINYFMFRAIFAHANSKQAPSTYIALRMLISNLKKVGVSDKDLVILAVDSPKGSWRRDVDPQYKANRKENREKHDINWTEEFKAFNELYEKLDSATPFHVVIADKLEADDIIAYSCRYFRNSECTIISVDSDYEQLLAFSNVKLFSPLAKRYKQVKNPYAVLASKIKKETADNLTSEITTEAEYLRREKIVTLLRLPEEVEKKVEEKIRFLPEKEFIFELLPFSAIREEFKTIYNDNRFIVSEEELSPREKRLKRERIKKEALKQKAIEKEKREKEREKIRLEKIKLKYEKKLEKEKLKLEKLKNKSLLITKQKHQKLI